MMKPLFTVLCALLLAGCATWNYPVEEAEEGVYYADSPPDYVYLDYGLSWGSMYPWIGPPYLYPMTFHSPYLYLGNRWYHPPFGTFDYWAMEPYGWRRHAPLTPYRPPNYGVSSEPRGVVTPAYRKSATDGYAKAYPPQLRVKSNAPGRPEPAFKPAARPPVRAATAAPVRRMSAPAVDRPARSMRPMRTPRMERPAPGKMVRDLD